MQPEKTFTLTARQLDLAIQCIARAEVEGAFADCVVPKIGAKVLAMLESKRNAPDTPDLSRVRVMRKSWAGSPAEWLAGDAGALADLETAGYAKRDNAGWWIPTDTGRALLG